MTNLSPGRFQTFRVLLSLLGLRRTRCLLRTFRRRTHHPIHGPLLISRSCHLLYIIPKPHTLFKFKHFTSLSALYHISILVLSAAQSKTGATGSVNLGVDITGPRTQVAPVGSGTSCTSPPVAIRRTCVEVAVGMAVEASTQELERPFINTIVVGGNPAHVYNNSMQKSNSAL